MSERWITAKEMEAICPSCAVTMNRRGITRVRASVIEEAKKVAASRPPSKIVSDLERELKKAIRREGMEMFLTQSPNLVGGDYLFNWLMDELTNHPDAPVEDDGDDSGFESEEVDMDIVHGWAVFLEPKMRRKFKIASMTAAVDPMKSLNKMIDEFNEILDEAQDDLEGLSEDNDVMRETIRDYFDGAKRAWIPRIERQKKKIEGELKKLKTSSEDPITAAVKEFRADKWKTMPKGWTEKSRKKFWESLTSRAPKHKVTQCIKEMEGKVGDPGAFCASLADRVDPGWRSRD